MQPQNRKFYLLVAVFLLCAVLMGVFSAGRGKSSVEKWKQEMRAKGEKFTIPELIPKRTGPVTNRTGELVRLGQLLAAQSEFHRFVFLDASTRKMPAGAISVADEQYTVALIDYDALRTEREPARDAPVALEDA